MSNRTLGPRPDDVQTGINIRVRRKRLGLSQTDLALGLGLTFQQIQKYERGSNRVSVSALMAIARTLKCSPASLLPTLDVSAEDAPDLFLEEARRLYDLNANMIGKLIKLSRRNLSDLERVVDVMVTATDIPDEDFSPVDKNSLALAALQDVRQ